MREGGKKEQGGCTEDHLARGQLTQQHLSSAADRSVPRQRLTKGIPHWAPDPTSSISPRTSQRPATGVTQPAAINTSVRSQLNNGDPDLPTAWSAVPCFVELSRAELLDLSRKWAGAEQRNVERSWVQQPTKDWASRWRNRAEAWIRRNHRSKWDRTFLLKNVWKLYSCAKVYDVKFFGQQT